MAPDTPVAGRSVRDRLGSMLVSSGSMLSDRDVRGFWRGRFKAGLAVQGLVSLSALGYLLLTPDGPHRLALTWLVGACVGLTAAGLLMLPRITGWILRPRFWMGWLVVACM